MAGHVQLVNLGANTGMTNQINHTGTIVIRGILMRGSIDRTSSDWVDSYAI